jgi:hypothetical protein
MSNLIPIPSEGHWALKHIMFDPATEEFVAFDEAGLEYGCYKNVGAAIYALEEYNKILDLAAEDRDRYDIQHELDSLR